MSLGVPHKVWGPAGIWGSPVPAPFGVTPPFKSPPPLLGSLGTFGVPSTLLGSPQSFWDPLNLWGHSDSENRPELPKKSLPPLFGVPPYFLVPPAPFGVLPPPKFGCGGVGPGPPDSGTGLGGEAKFWGSAPPFPRRIFGFPGMFLGSRGCLWGDPRGGSLGFPFPSGRFFWGGVLGVPLYRGWFFRVPGDF